MRRSAAITLILLGTLACRPARADDEPPRRPAWVQPGGEVGGHAETGGGVIPRSGFNPREQGGGVTLGLSFMSPVRPRVVTGFAIELSTARAAIAPQTVIGEQTYNVATVRPMARAELWCRPPFEPGGPTFFAMVGAGWNFNGAGTRITYAAGAPAGTAGDLHVSNRPAFELGGGTELVRKSDVAVMLEAFWLYDAAPYRLAVFGESDRRGTANLSGVSVVIGARFNPGAWRL